jgi:hypothetical protein
MGHRLCGVELRDVMVVYFRDRDLTSPSTPY